MSCIVSFACFKFSISKLGLILSIVIKSNLSPKIFWTSSFASLFPAKITGSFKEFPNLGLGNAESKI